MIYTVASLLEDPRRALELPLESVPALLAQCAAVQAALAARLAAGATRELLTRQANGTGAKAKAPDAGRWLTPQEAAGISGLSPRWLLGRKSTLPFAKIISERVTRFSETGLRAWMANRS